MSLVFKSAPGAIFKRFTEGKNALFANGRIGWPKYANQDARKRIVKRTRGFRVLSKILGNTQSVTKKASFKKPPNEVSSVSPGIRRLHFRTSVFATRNISVHSILINEDAENPSWSLLVELDLAIKEQQVNVSGATGKTDTRAFMEIGVLLSEKHSFMHDLESFFGAIFLDLHPLRAR